MSLKIEALWEALELDARAESQIPGSRGSDGWLTRRVVSDPSCELIAGIRNIDHRRALLLRIDLEDLPPRRLWPDCRGLEWVAEKRASEGGLFGVVLRDEAWSDVFSALAVDLVSRVRALSATAQISALLGGLARWQKFLQCGTEALSDEAMQGLVGELYFMSHVILPKAGPLNAVDSWTGPERADQDFQMPETAVEVKTSAGKPPHIVRIANERQLDPGMVDKLYLCHVILNRNQSVGSTVNDIVDEARRKVATNQLAAEKLEDRLIEAGYLQIHRPFYENGLFDVEEVTLFHVRDDFPRITSDDLAVGVGSVVYKLDISACKRFEVSLDTLDV